MTQQSPHDQEVSSVTSALKSTGGIARVAKAFRYSLQGVGHAVRFEAAFRQELIIAVPAMLALWFFPVSQVEKLILFATVILVLIVELLNSAIEAVVDRVSIERHPLSGRAKDLGSAAVFFSVCLAIVAWVTILLPTILAWWRAASVA